MDRQESGIGEALARLLVEGYEVINKLKQLSVYQQYNANILLRPRNRFSPIQRKLPCQHFWLVLSLTLRQ